MIILIGGNAMSRYHAGSLIAVASLVLAGWYGLFPHDALAIGEGAQANKYADWCAKQGGTINNVGGLGCVPGTPSPGVGLSSQQRAALGLAGALGSALGSMIQDSLAESERKAAMERMQRSWELEQERIKLEEERQRVQAERERKHRELLSKLKNSLGRTELAPKGMGSETLQLKSGTALFGKPANPVGTLQQETPVRGEIAMPAEPATVEGRPDQPGLVQTTEKAWDDYLAALQRKNQAEARRKQVETDRRIAEQIRREAEKKRQEQQARAAAIPPDQPEQKTVEDDKLAQAEKLLNDAIKLDEDATKELADARKNAEEAKTVLSDMEKKKQQAMKTAKE
jgi:hypothetical protein